MKDHSLSHPSLKSAPRLKWNQTGAERFRIQNIVFKKIFFSENLLFIFLENFLIIGLAMALIISAGGCRRVGGTKRAETGISADSAAKLQKIARIMMFEDSRVPDPQLFLLAKDADPEIRERVALGAGRIGSDKLIAIFEGLLKDPEARVREAACFALGISGLKEKGELLTPLLDDSNPAVRASAVDAVCRLNFEPLAARISERLSDPDPGVVGKTLLTIWKLKGIKVTDKVIELARSEDEALKWKAAYCLMRLSDPGSFQRLSGLSRERSPLIRSLVARALARIDHSDAGKILLDLSHDADWKVAVLALRSVSAKGKSMEQDDISDLLTSDNFHVVLAAMEAIPRLEGNRTEELLGRFLHHEKPTIRASAAAAFSSSTPDLFLKVAREMMKDDDWRVRAAVAEGLGSVVNEDSLSLILTLIDDDDDRVIPHALSSLLKQNPENPIIAINHLFMKKDFVIRATVISELTQILLKESVGEESQAEREKRERREGLKDLFVDLLSASYDIARSDQENDVRLEILNAASQMFTNSRAAEIVHSALKDSDYLVRKKAAGILQEKTGTDYSERVPPAAAGREAGYYLSALEYARKAKGAVIKTEKGEIHVEFSMVAPLTVKNFCDLAERGFYDGKNFHRVVSNFVIQDGCPRGDGSGGPGYSIRCEVSPLDYETGAMGMAHSGRDTGGCQFFITHSPQPHLNGNYTLFAHVTAGMDVVDRILPGDQIITIEIKKK